MRPTILLAPILLVLVLMGILPLWMSIALTIPIIVDIYLILSDRDDRTDRIIEILSLIPILLMFAFIFPTATSLLLNATNATKTLQTITTSPVSPVSPSSSQPPIFSPIDSLLLKAAIPLIIIIPIFAIFFRVILGVTHEYQHDDLGNRTLIRRTYGFTPSAQAEQANFKNEILELHRKLSENK